MHVDYKSQFFRKSVTSSDAEMCVFLMNLHVNCVFLMKKHGILSAALGSLPSPPCFFALGPPGGGAADRGFMYGQVEDFSACSDQGGLASAHGQQGGEPQLQGGNNGSSPVAIDATGGTGAIDVDSGSDRGFAGARSIHPGHVVSDLKGWTPPETKPKKHHLVQAVKERVPSVATSNKTISELLGILSSTPIPISQPVAALAPAPASPAEGHAAAAVRSTTQQPLEQPQPPTGGKRKGKGGPAAGAKKSDACTRWVAKHHAIRLVHICCALKDAFLKRDELMRDRAAIDGTDRNGFWVDMCGGGVCR